MFKILKMHFKTHFAFKCLNYDLQFPLNDISHDSLGLVTREGKGLNIIYNFFLDTAFA